MTITLETENAQTFALFRGWLYTRELRNVDDHVGQAVSWPDLIQLWVFGDAYLIPLLQNHIVDLYRIKFVQTWHLQSSLVPVIYATTVPGAQLRSLIINLIAAAGTELSVDPLHKDCWTEESLTDLVRALFNNKTKRQTAADVAGWDRCQFHVHEAGARCVAKVLDPISWEFVNQ